MVKWDYKTLSYVDDIIPKKPIKMSPSLKKDQRSVLFIFSSKYMNYQLDIIKEKIEKSGISVIINYREFSKQDYDMIINNDNHYCFIINQKSNCKFPENKFFFYQTEQFNTERKRVGYKDENFTKHSFSTLLSSLEHSIAIFDYSKLNLKYYPPKFKGKLRYFPFIKREKQYDILFYGTLNKRRKDILQHLSKIFSIQIVQQTFGNELIKLIENSRIVLNVHYFDNAILETSRITQALSYNVKIISEYPCHEDMDSAKNYENEVQFVEIIEDDLSNIEILEEAIRETLKKTLKTKQQHIKDSFDESIQYIVDVMKYPHLFHKYLLGLSTADDPIKYEIVQQKDVSGNYFAHLHCYDISKFNEIYCEYIKTIETYFNIVITYSIGEKKIDKYTVLKIPNRGLDIGAKFCMVQYLKDHSEDYSYILFLHSKSNQKQRKKYFEPLIWAIKENKFMKNINDYDGYFPDIQWEIQGDRLKMISGNPQFMNSNLPERNLLYKNELLKYLGCKNRTNRFVEGNVYLISKKVVERLFGNKKLYNILNRSDDFDYNWVWKRHRLQGTIREVYNEFKKKRLVPRDKQSFDGYIEHTFERVVLNVCGNVRICPRLGEQQINILIRNTYRPSYFPKCINSILNQTNQNFRIIMCYDDENCLEYLEKYKNNPKIEIFKATEVDKSKEAFYNLYCNQLLDRVEKGWIMFLDDDDLLIDKNSLQDIADNLDNKDNMLFWKVKIAKHIIYPKNINNIEKFHISGIGFCFHSTYKNLARWDCERCSDYRFITKLLENKKDFKRKFVNKILTGVQHTDKMGLLGRKENHRLHHLKKKIYVICWINKNKIKVINVDSEIIYNVLTKLKYNVSFLKIPFSYLSTKFDHLNNSILLDGDIYIFSEVLHHYIYDFIFKNNKEIICIPNIDSYSTYKPIIEDRETDFIKALKKYSKNNNFNIWCKTKQIYNWLKEYNFSNLYYTHFCYNIIPLNELLNNNIVNILNKEKEYILLDTGDSTTKRKYLEEILDIFISNNDIPFTLLVKTTPNVYNMFLKNTKYVNKYTNIEIIAERLIINDLIYLYKKCKYFIYCSKFDGYGLSLAQAIKYNLFIFTFDGLPWCELLELYPRKCLINCKQYMSKSMGVKIKGKALSQIYYKGNFDDLTYKLKNNKEKYEQIIDETYEDCQFVNQYNNKVFTSNIKNYFQKKYKICKVYNNTSVGVISYIDREKLFIENLMNIISQTNEIVIYLNSATSLIKTFLSNISNVYFKICENDLKSLTKLKVISYLNNDVNLIIDDDIIYPLDYIEYTYNILKKQADKESFYSYNGYTDKFKYPFTIKTQLCLQDNCNLGSGTLFYNKNTLTDNKLEQFLERILSISVDINIQLFCDKIFLQFCQENKIKTKIISPKYSYWLINNPKMKYGMLEMKKKLDIYDLKYIETIPLKDKLINIHNNLPNNVLIFFVNKIDIINTKVNYFDYYQIYVKDNILYINDNVNNVFNINLNDQSLFKKLNILVTEISKLYNKDN